MPASSGTHGDPEGVRAAHGWRVAGLAVLAVWALLLVLAVVLWVRVAVFADPDDGANGAIRLFGAPFVLLALGILWWVWRSARHLRHHRVEGWTLPLALGGVALVQSVVTMLPLALSSAGTGGDAVAFLAGAGLGVVSLAVGLLGRRAWVRLEDPQRERPGDPAGHPVSDPE
ncbi:MAG TPA: hypothetical protein VFI44_09495 [Ornithinibacter sp.]|nr:hypothetical protein [Ornithinibacter sp.]